MKHLTYHSRTPFALQILMLRSTTTSPLEDWGEQAGNEKNPTTSKNQSLQSSCFTTLLYYCETIPAVLFLVYLQHCQTKLERQNPWCQGAREGKTPKYYNHHVQGTNPLGRSSFLNSSRIPKQLLYSELRHGKQIVEIMCKWYKETLKT